MVIQTEKLMREAVAKLGGERLDLLLRPAKGRISLNADYVFKSRDVIAELKCLEDLVFTQEFTAKLTRIANSWNARGLTSFSGLVEIKLRELPKICQEEWLALMAAPLQRNVIKKANRQIRETKRALGMHSAKGVLLIANDSNTDLPPHDLLILLARILGKRRPTGEVQYSSINGLCLFSANLPVHLPKVKPPIVYWMGSIRDEKDKDLLPLIDELENAWHSQVSRIVGIDIPTLEITTESIEDLSF